MTEPAKCYCGSISWERNIEESRYTCCSCKRPLWQPIETAPKNKKRILAKRNKTIKIVVWCAALGEWGNPQEWGDDGLFRPTHWMPLPDLPKLG